MRILAPAFLCAFGLGALAFACSSSDDEAPAATCDGGACPDAGGEIDAGGPAVEVDAGPLQFTGGGGDGGTTGGGFDAGTPVTGSDAGTFCLTGSQTEAEDNSVVDSANNVNARSGSFCGTIDSDQDIDFLRIQLPGNAQSLYMNLVANKGGLRVALTVDGKDEPFPSTTPGSMTFAPGKNYVLRLRSAQEATPPIDYRLELTIQ